MKKITFVLLVLPLLGAGLFVFDPWVSGKTLGGEQQLMAGATATIDGESTEQKFVPLPGCYTFARLPCGSITISGTVANAGSLQVALVSGSFAGAATDYASILDATRVLDSAGAEIRPAAVSGNTWTVSFNIVPGDYHVLVYDADCRKLLAQEDIVVRE